MIAAPKQISARRVAALVVIAGLALAVSGCGRRGPLEPAPDPSAVAKPAQDSTAPEVHRKVTPVTPPNAPFVLDPVL